MAYPIIFLGNYIRVDTDFIFTTIKINLDVNYRQFKETSFVAQMNAASYIGGQDKRIIITITSVYKYIGPFFYLSMRLLDGLS